MTTSDVPEVAALAEQAFRGVYQYDWKANAEALLVASGTGRVYVVVAEEAGKPIGYANLRGWPAGGWIDQVAVHEEHRRKGVGRALLDAVVEAAKQREYWKVSLIVSETEADTLAFYRAYGFEDVGPMKHEIGRGVNGVLLSFIVDYSLHPNA